MHLAERSISAWKLSPVVDVYFTARGAAAAVHDLGLVLINLRRCPVRPDTDRLCATAVIAMGQKATLC